LHGDSHVVNCIERHPYDIFTLATSGIDDDVKIWGCSAVERVDGLSVKDKKRMERNINQRQMSMRPYDYGRHYIPNGTIMGYSESESEEEEDWNF
jgi:WD repeat-containing protein 42A